jgi:4'-phosphopantetheinyl transferase
VPTQASEATASRFATLLTPDEKLRADRFRLAHLRTSFVIARGALRTILALHLGTAPALLRFAYGPHGKPELAPHSSLCFNASHSGHLAVFAVTLGCDLGIDLEQLRPVKNMQQVANRFFCSEEAAEFISLPDSERQRAFFLCWTRKEAYIKATGEGLSAALDSFRVTLLPSQPAAILHIGGSIEAARHWTLHPLEPAPGYLATLAYCDRARPLTLHAIADPVALLDL